MAVNQKPSIVKVVSEYVHLRRAGKELVGLCPFHAEKSPSFAVNEKKGVFHCHGCQEGGDVIDFMRKLRGMSYRQAIAALGMDPNARRPAPDWRLRTEARRLAAWANNTTQRVMSVMREIGQQSLIAKDLKFSEEGAALARKWTLFEMLAEDLQNKKYVLGLYRYREAIEHLHADALIEPWPEWPALTPEYLAFIEANLPAPEKGRFKRDG
jgi:CHC2 zinc finger